MLEKIKMVIGIEKFDDAKILNDRDDKLRDKVTLLISCFIKDDDKFYPQIFLGKALVA